MRSLGLPPAAGVPLSLYHDDAALKAHPAYRAAKSGDADAAIRLVRDLARPLCEQAARRFAPGTFYVAPHAIEASGENALPMVLAAAISTAAAGQAEADIVQREQVFHTGADPMERLNARATFDGAVRQGALYVLVDDVTTMGGTLADLGHHIQAGGGIVAGAVVLANATRSGRLVPDKGLVDQLERRFGDVIRASFQIIPIALTAEEASYLIGFRTADEIRNRSAKAKQATIGRLRARGIQGLGTAANK